MGLRSAVLTLKQKLEEGDRTIHNYVGLLSLKEIDLLRQASMEQSFSMIKGWLDTGKILLLKSIPISWKATLLKYYKGKDSFLNKLFDNLK